MVVTAGVDVGKSSLDVSISEGPVMRFDTEMRRFLDRLRKRGKSGSGSVVAVMRKMLLHLNTVARRGTPRVPNLR